MADTQLLPIASAVVLPEETSSPGISNPAKRRFSNSVDEQSKRPRLNDGDYDESNSNTSPNGEGKARQDRRASGRQEERKRGQRLFGNLLGTLSQSSSSAAQRRRADIEKKQQEKLKLQAKAYNEKQTENLGRLKEIRTKEQAKYDEQSMRIRHSNMLAMAHSLQTKTRPILYYKPWDIRPAEENIIKNQIKDAEETIDRELDDFEQKRQRQRSIIKPAEGQQSLDVEIPNGNGAVDVTNDKNASDHPMEDSTNEGPDVSDQAPEKVLTPVPKEEDDGGEVVLEGDEDTVIY